MTPLITLTTDFGLEDPFVGIMKGVILGICPNANVVDVTHGVAAQDVLAGLLALEAARPYFPVGTIHVAVVDPGVGTAREALVVITHREIYIAPDNGLLSFIPEAEIREIRGLRNPSLLLRPVSRTFHGRDVFAPAAARLATGLRHEELGPCLGDFLRIALPVVEISGNEVRGEIIGFDRFGNGVTSIREQDFPDRLVRVFVKGVSLPLVSVYGAATMGAGLGLTGSSGRLEICVRGGSARERLSLQRGDPVILR